MSGDQVKASESFRMLHDYNTEGPPLAARLRDENDRFDRFSRSMDGLLLDFSRTAIDDRVFAGLIGLAAACGVEAERARLFRGE